MPLKSRNRPQVHNPNYIKPIVFKETVIDPISHEPVILEIPMRRLPTYLDEVEIRELDVEGTKGTSEFEEAEDRWIWIKKDQGAWDGPNRDWRSSHKDKYFKYLKHRRVVITAGTNQGMYVRFFAKKFGHVYAFEPDPLNFHCMSVNNQVDNVIKINAGLGEEAGWCFVQRNGFENTGTWSINETTGHIPVMAIDSFCFPIVDLIQLDTEGYEEKVLKGAKRTIQRCQPVIAVENGQTEGIQALMDELKYREVDQSVADKIFVPSDRKV